jgi:2-phosphosulfolactate phosphatase
VNALRLPRVLGAAQPDWCGRHALVTDGPIAFRAREAGLAVGMAVAVAGLSFHAISVSRVRVHAAFTPAEEGTARVGIVVDVVRATSSIAQALAAGYERVLCCREIEEATALRAELGDEAVVGGERSGVVVDGFDVGASPREFAESPRARTLILSTTNGTATVLTAADRCETVLLGSLLNLRAVAAAALADGGDVTVFCAGFKGTFALDDAYCAGRIVAELGGERTDAAVAAELLARSFSSALEGLNARTYGPPGLEADVEFCARESVLETVPRFARMIGSAAEIVA